MLLPTSNAKAKDSLALRLAADYGFPDCVELLLPASDARACGSEALHDVVESCSVHCVRLTRMLLPVSDEAAQKVARRHMAIWHPHE